jgi:hypothetical protein
LDQLILNKRSVFLVPKVTVEYRISLTVYLSDFVLQLPSPSPQHSVDELSPFFLEIFCENSTALRAEAVPVVVSKGAYNTCVTKMY